MSFSPILANAAPQTTSIGPGAPQAAAPAGPVGTPQVVVQVSESPNGAPAQLPPEMPWYANPMVLILLMIAVMFFFTFRSNKKQQQKRQRMLDAIVKGTRVMLNTGVYGTIVEVKDKTYMVEIADKVVVEAVKGGVAEVVSEDAAVEKK